jgi:hypothetical protein
MYKTGLCAYCNDGYEVSLDYSSCTLINSPPWWKIINFAIYDHSLKHYSLNCYFLFNFYQITKYLFFTYFPMNIITKKIYRSNKHFR